MLWRSRGNKLVSTVNLFVILLYRRHQSGFISIKLQKLISKHLYYPCNVDQAETGDRSAPDERGGEPEVSDPPAAHRKWRRQGWHEISSLHFFKAQIKRICNGKINGLANKGLDSDDFRCSYIFSFLVFKEGFNILYLLLRLLYRSCKIGCKSYYLKMIYKDFYVKR